MKIAGLCDTCRFQKLITNDRGSVFSRCERSLTEPEYPKYPRIPVLQCSGYVRRNEGSQCQPCKVDGECAF